MSTTLPNPEGAESKISPKPMISAADLFAKIMDSEAAHTSFGKLILADEKSQPQFSFGTGERFNMNKFYLSKEMAEAQPAGKASPGPVYQVSADAKYRSLPQWGFGTAKKNPLNIQGVYYEEAVTDDPISADQTRKPRCKAPKFGTAPRMPFSIGSATCDHQYYPERPDFKKLPKYSLGARRENEKVSGPYVLQFANYREF